MFAANFGYSYVTSYHLDGNVLSIAKDPASPKVPGDGRFRALNNTVSSGPSDNWLTPDGEYLYQLYGNASKLVGLRGPGRRLARGGHELRRSRTTARRGWTASDSCAAPPAA